MGIIEWAAVSVLLAAGALFFGFPFGVAVGYAWRDRISRARRALVVQQRRRAELDGAVPALALPDVEPARLVDVLHAGKPAGEPKAASPGPSALVSANETGIPQGTMSRARKKANGSNDRPAERSGQDGKHRKVSTKSRLKIVIGNVLQDRGSSPGTPRAAPPSGS